MKNVQYLIVPCLFNLQLLESIQENSNENSSETCMNKHKHSLEKLNNTVPLRGGRCGFLLFSFDNSVCNVKLVESFFYTCYFSSFLFITRSRYLFYSASTMRNCSSFEALKQ